VSFPKALEATSKKNMRDYSATTQNFAKIGEIQPAEKRFSLAFRSSGFALIKLILNKISTACGFY